MANTANVRVQASNTSAGPCTIERLCMRACTCATLLISASCAEWSRWPLTAEVEPTWLADCGMEAAGGLWELVPLSVITLIKPALWNYWLAAGFVFPSSRRRGLKVSYRTCLWPMESEVGARTLPFYERIGLLCCDSFLHLVIKV